jgi:hypothetical protein
VQEIEGLDSLHCKPVAFVPFIIRWGPDASSDLLSAIGALHQARTQGRGAAAPWAGMHVGFEPFPRRA